MSDPVEGATGAAAPDPPQVIAEDLNRLVLRLRQRLRSGKLMTFRDWIKNVRELLDLLDWGDGADAA